MLNRSVFFVPCIPPQHENVRTNDMEKHPENSDAIDYRPGGQVSVDYPNRQNWVFIENEGALFRGPARGVPIEVWNGSKFVPYPLAKQSRHITWGKVLN